MMKQGCCAICKVFGLLVIVGALNWGLVGGFGFNLVEKLLGVGTTATRVVYILVGVSALAKLGSCFMKCPACKA
jgi:uncharacterized membrane protein YuzA (DUF378 family)